MSSDCIVISSDDEIKIQTDIEFIKVEWNPNKHEEEVLYISSSSDDDKGWFLPVMKSDPEELPKIHFETREARRHRHRHKSRRRSSENESKSNSKESKHTGLSQTKHSVYIPSDEPARIPPLPDLSLFHSETPTSNSKSERPQSKRKKPSGLRKKRQSIEAIKTKERQILGALFAVDDESQDSNHIVTGTRNRFVENNREKNSEKAKEKLLLKKNNQLDLTVRNEKERHFKNTPNKDINTVDKSLEIDKSQSQKEGKRSRHSSEGSEDGKNNFKEKIHKNVQRNDASEACTPLDKEMSKCLSAPVLDSSYEEENIQRLNKKSNSSTQNFYPRRCDNSETCHQIGSRLGPFELLTSLGRNYKKELENLRISPTSLKAVKEDLIPMVKIEASNFKLPMLNLRSRSFESSDSESGSEKARSLKNVFSDGSEVETDNSVENTDNTSESFVDCGKVTLSLNEDSLNEQGKVVRFNDALTRQGNIDMEVDDNKDSSEIILNQTSYQSSVLPADSNGNFEALPLNETFNFSKFEEGRVTPYKNLNYQVRLEEFSDISEDDDGQKQVGVEIGSNISDIDDASNNSGNSTLLTAGCDVSVIHISSDSIDNGDGMPMLEEIAPSKDEVSTPTYDMPILEKYGEVYSSFRYEMEETEMLPDISEDEGDFKENATPSELKEPSSKSFDKQSSQSSEVSKSCDNIFKRFSSSLAKSHETSSSVSSTFKPVFSGMSNLTSATCSLKSSKSDNALSNPKECSIPKSRKRIRKSYTCLSFDSSGINSAVPSTSTSHAEHLPLSKQMDQLTVYMKDFLRLNDSKTVLPKIPEAHKNIVYGGEEDGLLNLGHALKFIEHFCQKYVIPSDLCNDIIKAAFLSECSLLNIHWAYSLLSELNMRRTAEIEMNWDTIDQCLKVALSASKGKEYYSLLQSTLLLQLGVDVLKMDLYTRELSDNRQIRKTLAYKMFAYDVSTGNRKSLIYYLNQALHAGQCRTGTNGETFQLPDVLPMLQDLLALCVDVSSSCIDCANTLASDMVNTYKFLPNLADKQILIKSVSSHLLQCKLVQQVLESQYDCYLTLGGAFPDSLEDIVQCFFKVKPLKNHLTPPTTPNEDLLLEEEGHFNRFSAEVTEEIAILLYFVVVSYLQASHDKLYVALRLRANLPEGKKKLRRDDVEELGRMQGHVQELEEHLRSMTPDLTENTEHYLFLMSCLGDLGQVPVE